MSLFPKHRDDRIILLLSALICSFGLFHPWFAERVPDDAFYYFQIARNIANTGRSTFDGVALATGYHPLWMGIAVLVYFVAGSALPKVLLIVSLVLFLIYALTVLRLLERLQIEGRDALLFKLLLILNPVFLTMGWSNDLETALLMLCILWLMRECLLRLAGMGGNSTIAGIACAFTFLSRLDSILFTYPAYIWAFRRDLRRNPLPALIPILAVAGFVSIHHVLYGRFIPSSADAIRYACYPHYVLVHHMLFHTGYYIDAPAHLIQLGRNSAEILTSLGGVTSRLFGSTIVAKIVAILVAVAFVIQLIRKKVVATTLPITDSSAEYLIWGAAIVPLSVLLAAYVTTVRTLHFRPWYYPPLGLAVGCAMLALWKAAHRRASRLLVTAVICGIGVSAVSDFCQRWNPSNPWSGELIAKKAIASLPPGTLVGAFNSGIYGWAAPNRVINLDGLANDKAFDSIRHHDFQRYLTEMNIHYVLDVDDLDTMRENLASRITPGTRVNVQVVNAWQDENPNYAHRLYKVSFPDR